MRYNILEYCKVNSAASEVGHLNKRESAITIYIYIYIYTSVDPCIYMHGVLGARVLGFRVLWDSSFILLPCASASFLESSRAFSESNQFTEAASRVAGLPGMPARVAGIYIYIYIYIYILREFVKLTSS